MKVLHLTAGNLFGGIETYLLTLARQRSVCPAMEPHFGVCFAGRLREELTACGVGVHELGRVRLSRPWTVWRARRRLLQLLDQQEFAAVVCHGSWPHVVFAPAVRQAGRRLVYALHAAYEPRDWLNRWAARTPPDVVIANSHFTAATYRAAHATACVSTVYLPVAAPRIDAAAARATLRAAWGTPPETVVVLLVGRMEPLKGHAVLLDALRRLGEPSGWEAWIAGGVQRPQEPLYYRQLVAQAEQPPLRGRVRFLGERRDVPALLAAADIYCQPNIQPESFGISFIEALYAGRPVVTTTIGGGAEIVTPECGILCPPGDAAAIAEALRRLITDPPLRQSLGQAGPARAAELCDPARRIPQLAEVLLPGGVTEQISPPDAPAVS